MLTLWKESYDQPRQNIRASLIAQLVKNLPAMQETWVQSLGWENPLEKGMATHSSALAWRIPWTENPGWLWGRKESDTTERLTLGTGIIVGCWWIISVMPQRDSGL